MIRGQEVRLEKLERTSPRGEAVFVAWGWDRDAADRVLAEACERGEVSKGDRAICAVWPYADDLPCSRWATDDQISDREMDAILDTLMAMAGLDAWPASPPSYEPDPRFSKMSDNELFMHMAMVVR